MLLGQQPRARSAPLAALCLALATVCAQLAAARTRLDANEWLPVSNATEVLAAMSTSTTQHIQLRQHLSASEVAAAILARIGSTDLTVFAPVPSTLQSITVCPWPPAQPAISHACLPVLTYMSKCLQISGWHGTSIAEQCL